MAVGAESTLVVKPMVTTSATSGAPTGSVTVTATNTATSAVTTLCTLPVASATGANGCSPAAQSGLGAGTYTVTATYPGDANFAGSNGSAVGTLTVTKAAASTLTVALTPSATTVTYGNESTVTYAVGFGGVTPAPTGTVAVTSGATTLCTVTLSQGSGSCAVSSPTALATGATHAVVATWNATGSGDPNYSGSVSSTAPVNLAVTQASTSTTDSIVPAAVVSIGKKRGNSQAAIKTAL